MHLAGCTVIVAGGSSGLGAACVRRLASGGAGVVIADVDPRGESLASELGDGVRFSRTDVLSESEVRRAIDVARELPGVLRGAVVCAGVIHAERMLGKQVHALESFRRVVEVNLVGTFNVARLAAEAIRAAPLDADGDRGVIVLTSSVAAYEGQLGQSAYAASKGGVAALVLPLARDLGRDAIRAVAVAPGVFDTPMMQAVSENYRDALTAAIPCPPRLGRPDEFAALVQHVMENPYLNGTVLRLDGALRMPPR